MLYLVTGTPGAGKTLNSIKFVNESKQFHGRAVYYYGIRDLKPEMGWEELTEEQALKWYELPPSSVIFFDEAYTIFPVRHGAKKPPPHVEKLATHRHHGFDIVMVCQKVTGQLDPFLRGLVGQHHHYARIFGSQTVSRLVWDACQENPNSTASRGNANVVTLRLDKKYFGSYHSADEHTHRMNLPWGKIVLVIVPAIAVVVLLMFIFGRFEDRIGKTAPDDVQQQQLQPVTRQGVTTAAADPVDVPQTFAARFKPEIEGLPWTAPAYAALIEPKTWPRPAACIRRHSTNSCRCYTQQATPMDIPFGMCLQIVNGGFFDWTKDESGIERAAWLDEDSSTSSQPGRPLDAPPRPRAILISHEHRPTGTAPEQGNAVLTVGMGSYDPESTDGASPAVQAAARARAGSPSFAH